MNIKPLQLAVSLISSFFIKLSREFLLPTSSFFIIAAILLNVVGSKTGAFETAGNIAISFTLIIFTHALGYKVSQDDFDSNSVLFLESLPIQKWTVFISRFIAAYLILIIGSAICYACLGSIALDELQINIYDYTNPAGIGHWLICAFGSLALTTLLASLPSLAGLFTLLLYISLIILAQFVNATYYYFIPSVSLIESESLPLQTYGLITLTGLLCLGVSLLLFRLRVSQIIQGSSIKITKKKRFFKKAIMTTASLIVFSAIAFTVISKTMGSSNPDTSLTISHGAPTTTKVSKKLVRAKVGNFTVRYPKGKSQLVKSLIKELPKIDGNVRTLIGSPPEELIEIIFTPNIPVHAAGIMNGNIIRIGILGVNEKRTLLRTIAHEIAHVYVENLTASAASKRSDNEGHILHEGCAEWIASKLYPQKNGSASKHHSFRSALLWSEFKIDELFKGRELAESWGNEAVYVLGPMYIDSIIRAGDEDCSLQDLFTAFKEAHEENPENSFLWPETLSKLKRNIPQLEEFFYSQLNDFKQSNNTLPDHLSDTPPLEYRRVNGDLEFRLTQKIPPPLNAAILFSKNGTFSSDNIHQLKEGVVHLAPNTGLHSSKTKVRFTIMKGLETDENTTLSRPYTLLSKANTTWLPLDSYDDR